MHPHFQQTILTATGAQEFFEMQMIQQLWSGYGVITRYGLKGSSRASVVVKHVRLPKRGRHPRGWNTDLSHQRKLKSYEVETAWYRQWSRHCDENCHVPACLACESLEDEVFLVLEDLNATGYEERRSTVSLSEMKTCLKWLAHFHARFMGQTPDRLWPVGTYWHLETRPDELKVLKDQALKNAAGTIDLLLRESPYQTFVHGDAKLANFCFSPCGTRVAAVDFQYVGGGCGMKDVAYFIGSCLGEEDCERRESELLECYFRTLTAALKDQNNPVDPSAVERDWRRLYPVAWTDFHRFIKGWSPGHWKIHDYSERVARRVVEQLCN
ncbi:MAG: ecdysteroid 22-kinase family protein [Candidatus Omnitrophica bacterium]|nr:ecdysteroid 22-kinase family protein [Candidatus Omnitrophota bacterium]